MNKTLKCTSIMILMILITIGTCHAEIKALDSNNSHHYVSYGTEYYKWDEYSQDKNEKYVSENGPRFHVNFGSNNYLDVSQGLLKAWDSSVMFGIISYKGSTLDDQVDVPNGHLKGKTYYTGYSIDMTRGYRYRASTNVSLDVNGIIGGQAWLRNIRSNDVYLVTQNQTRQYTAVEVSLQPYAKIALAANWQMTHNSVLSVEGGGFYPIKTWTHSNQGNVWFEPKSELSPFTSLTLNINKKLFIKTIYMYQRYGKSAEEQGVLNGRDVGYYQPATATSTVTFDIGYYF